MTGLAARGHTAAMSVIAFPQAPDGVEIRHLRAFVAVAEELNFSRAAARLYLSQPALSRQIRALERLLGCELLRRSTHRVELTVAGSALLDRARRLLADLDEAIAATQSVGGELANRMAAMWAPVLEVSRDRDIEQLREAYETFLAQSEVPEDIGVRPVNAQGVSSLAVTPAGETGAAVLYLHGGGFTLGSAYGYRPLVGALVAAAGVGALVPDYRLAPEHPFPAGLEDALAVTDALRPDVVAGDSAGANLAAVVARKRPQLKFQLLVYPATDAGVNLPSYAEFGRYGLTADAMRHFWGLYLDGADGLSPDASPLRADLAGVPPAYVLTASHDVLRDDGEAYAAKLRAAGVPVTLRRVEGAVHGFWRWQTTRIAREAVREAGTAIRSALG